MPPKLTINRIAAFHKYFVMITIARSRIKDSSIFSDIVLCFVEEPDNLDEILYNLSLGTL